MRSTQKKQEAERFLRNPGKALEANKRLASKDPLKAHPSSNVLFVLGKYLQRRRRG